MGKFGAKASLPSSWMKQGFTKAASKPTPKPKKGKKGK